MNFINQEGKLVVLRFVQFVDYVIQNFGKRAFYCRIE